VGKQVDLLQGTLDILILKAVSLGRLHGYGILLRIQQISGEQLIVQQGSLYPALYRLEHTGALLTEWARVTTIAGRSITPSPITVEDSLEPKLKSGAVWRRWLARSCTLPPFPMPNRLLRRSAHERSFSPDEIAGQFDVSSQTT
jgi:hypothetical protein